jgi:DNA-binding HxlR family transcriptional regulator
MRRGSELPQSEIAEFFERKGSVHIIELLGTTGSTWSEIEADVDISPATLSKRIGEAEELGLIERVVNENDTPSPTKYTLTHTLGTPVWQQMNQIKLGRTARALRNIRQDFEENKQELVDWVQSDRFEEVYTAREAQGQEDGRMFGAGTTDERRNDE